MDQFAPHYLFHATKAPEFVVNAEQKASYGPEWSAKYRHQIYPKVLYAKPAAPDLPMRTKTVWSAQDEATAGEGWEETPAAFEPGYVKPKPQPSAEELEAAKAALEAENAAAKAALEAENADLRQRLAQFQGKGKGKD